MKNVSSKYKKEMQKYLRNRSYMIVTVGIISNEAQASANVSSITNYLSDNQTLFKDRAIESKYATLEENVFKLDGSMIFPPENTGYQQLVNETACISDNVGKGITVNFDNFYDIKGLTIRFGEYYPTQFTVTTSDDTVHTYSNDSETFTTDDSFNHTDKITIMPLSFVNGDNKRLRIESMLMGIGIVFQNEDIESASFTDSKSFISEELPQIDFNITCFDKNKRFRVDDSNSFINYLETGQEISVSMGYELDDGTTEWLNMPRTYLSYWSSNNNKVAFTSTDRFALMTEKYTLGNTIHSRTLYEEAESVLRDAGLQPDEYEISDILRTITIINPMPEVTHAEALQLIANAGRCLLVQNENGVIKLVPNFENILDPSELIIDSESHTFWSNPQSITRTNNSVYADLTNNFFALDGSMNFIPPENSGIIVDNSGYVSSQVSNHVGKFYKNYIPSDYKYTDGNKTETAIVWTVDENNYIHLNYPFPRNASYQVLTEMPLKKGKYYLFGLPYMTETIQEKFNVEMTYTFYDSNKNILTTSVLNWRNATPIYTMPEDGFVSLDIKVFQNGTNYAYNDIVFRPMIGDEDVAPIGAFTDWKPKPKLTIKLPTAYTYYGINLLFANPIKSFTIRTYEGGVLKDTLNVEADSNKQTFFEINHAFYSFDTMEFEFNQTSIPYQRVVLKQLSFGKLSEYELVSKNMTEKPLGIMEEKVQSVNVKIFTFEKGASGEQPKALDNNVYSTYTVNSTGSNPTFGNQLISTPEHALEVAKWLANYYANNISYKVNYRGEPRIDAGDYIFLESEVLNNLQVEVESHTTNFNGALSGSLTLRRATNLINE